MGEIADYYKNEVFKPEKVEGGGDGRPVFMGQPAG